MVSPVASTSVSGQGQSLTKGKGRVLHFTRDSLVICKLENERKSAWFQWD